MWNFLYLSALNIFRVTIWLWCDPKKIEFSPQGKLITNVTKRQYEKYKFCKSIENKLHNKYCVNIDITWLNVHSTCTYKGLASLKVE